MYYIYLWQIPLSKADNQKYRILKLCNTQITSPILQMRNFES